MMKTVALVLLLALAGATAQDSIVSVVSGNPDFTELAARLTMVSAGANLWWEWPDGGQWAGSYRCHQQLTRG